MDESKPAPADLERLRRRDGDAFASLVQTNERLVVALAQSMGFFGADLDDSVMEVFANVFMSLPGFQGRSSLQTWLYRIAIRTLGKLRSQKRDVATHSLRDEAKNVVQPLPGCSIEEEETKQRLWSAVAALEPRSAAAVELHYRQGWTLPRIAQVLECPEGTVKTILFRAREALQKVLGKEEIHP